ALPCHARPGTLSQRRLPMITAAAPSFTWYERRLGPTICQRVTTACFSSEARRSWITSDFRFLYARVARATIDDASGGGHCRGIVTGHVVTDPSSRATRTTMRFGAFAAAVAR